MAEAHPPSHHMKTNWMVTRVVALLAIALPGCGTVTTRTKGDAGPYHGFGHDMEKVCSADEWLDLSGQGYTGSAVPFFWPRGLLWVLDAPLSLVADTLLLPADALRSSSSEEKVRGEAGRPDAAPSVVRHE